MSLRNAFMALSNWLGSAWVTTPSSVVVKKEEIRVKGLRGWSPACSRVASQSRARPDSLGFSSPVTSPAL